MGNSSNSKVRKRSDSVQIKGKSNETFSKSRSMVELGSKSKRPSTAASTRSEKSKLTPRGSTYSSASGSVTRSKSFMRRDISHPISPQGREIIGQCFDNPHSEFGNKVLQRIFEKRPDYQSYVYALGKEKSFQMSVRLKELVEDIVSKIYDPDYISTVSRQYGEEHVELKQYGFKPEFWVAIADAITMEGVILDQANHQPADTVAAWSSLVTLMFSSVRDGYYTALRRQRLSSRRCLRRQATIDSNSGAAENADGSAPNTSASTHTSTSNGTQEIAETKSPIELGPPVLCPSRRTSSQSTDSYSSTGRVNGINIMAPVNGHCTPQPVPLNSHLIPYRPIFE